MTGELAWWESQQANMSVVLAGKTHQIKFFLDIIFPVSCHFASRMESQLKIQGKFWYCPIQLQWSKKIHKLTAPYLHSLTHFSHCFTKCAWYSLQNLTINLLKVFSTMKIIIIIGGRDFPHPSRPAQESTQPAIRCIKGTKSFSWVKRPGRGVDHSPHLAPR